jgi:hypothetical protein
MRTDSDADIPASLAAAQNANGGWGWRPGSPGNTECTALAVWALTAQGGSDSAGSIERGLEWLRARQQADGSWPMGDQVSASSWMSAVAVLALAQIDSGDQNAIRGAEWLLGQESRGRSWLLRLALRLFSSRGTFVDQDSSLIGWPWTPGTTAWVEPTAWSLLALKHLLPVLPAGRTAERIRQGELVLSDRMCYGGGWNYGNRKVMGEELLPYPDTTALALLALHDRPSDQVSASSLVRLREMLSGTRSRLVLALSALCMQLYGEDVSELRADLRERVRSTGAGDDTRTLALMLLALDERTRHFEVDRDA